VLIRMFLVPGAILVIRFIRTDGVTILPMSKASASQMAQDDMNEQIMSHHQGSEEEREKNYEKWTGSFGSVATTAFLL
jgi:hypothetical protein